MNCMFFSYIFLLILTFTADNCSCFCSSPLSVSSLFLSSSPVFLYSSACGGTWPEILSGNWNINAYNWGFHTTKMQKKVGYTVYAFVLDS